MTPELQQWRDAARHLDAQARLRSFLACPKVVQDEFWTELERDWLARRTYDHERERHEVLSLGMLGQAPPDLRAIRYALQPKPPRPATADPSGGDRQSIDDALAEITTAEYVERIARVPVDRRVIFCPLPSHDDSRTPNFYAYEHNWRCYACGASGRIYQFAGLMWGYALPLRGRAFNEVFDRLVELFRLQPSGPTIRLKSVALSSVGPQRSSGDLARGPGARQQEVKS